MSASTKSISIRPMQPEEAESVSRFVQGIFYEFVAPDLLPNGVEEFLRHIDPVAMRERLERGELILLAEVREELAGVIDIRKGPHISLLFVDPRHHGQGIARQLLNSGISQCRIIDTDNPKITVNSSLYAVEIYRRLGFEQTKEEQLLNGIRFIPMAKKLTPTDNMEPDK